MDQQLRFGYKGPLAVDHLLDSKVRFYHPPGLAQQRLRLGQVARVHLGQLRALVLQRRLVQLHWPLG